MTKDSLVRYATKEDADFFYPNKTRFYSMRAWVLEYKGERIMIGGILLVKGRYTAFCKMIKKAPNIVIWKASKIVIDELRKLNFPITSIRETEIKNSKAYLERIGFVFNRVQNNQEIYILCKL